MWVNLKKSTWCYKFVYQSMSEMFQPPHRRRIGSHHPRLKLHLTLYTLFLFHPFHLWSPHLLPHSHCLSPSTTTKLLSIRGIPLPFNSQSRLWSGVHSCIRAVLALEYKLCWPWRTVDCLFLRPRSQPPSSALVALPSINLHFKLPPVGLYYIYYGKIH